MPPGLSLRLRSLAVNRIFLLHSLKTELTRRKGPLMPQPVSSTEPSKLYRWLVLLWLSITMFGNYYFYDALEPLADVLQKQLHYTDQNIGLLNSFYSIAPIATVLIGGILIDRLGVRRALL